MKERGKKRQIKSADSSTSKAGDSEDKEDDLLLRKY
jgi:hypothetical protein